MNGKTLMLGGALAAALPMAAAAGSDKDGEMTDGEFVAMESISVPIIDGGKVEGTLHFRIVLEASDGVTAESLESHLAALRAEALAAGAEFSRLRASPFLAVDAHRLAEDLTESLRASEAGITRVLLVEVSAKSA